jgi:hypothetical protein
MGGTNERPIERRIPPAVVAVLLRGTYETFRARAFPRRLTEKDNVHIPRIPEW